MASNQLSSSVQWVGLATIALATFHVISTLLLAVLGLAPSSSRWPLLLTFAGVLAMAGAAVGLQNQLSQSRLRAISGTISGSASGAILGFFIGGQLSEQQTFWAVVGLSVGGVCLGSVAGWAYRKQRNPTQKHTSTFAVFCRRAVALTSGLCAYGLAFGLGAWTWIAISAERIGLAVLLGLLCALYLWCTRQAIALVIHAAKQ